MGRTENPTATADMTTTADARSSWVSGFYGRYGPLSIYTIFSNNMPVDLWPPWSSVPLVTAAEGEGPPMGKPRQVAFPSHRQLRRRCRRLPTTYKRGPSCDVKPALRSMQTASCSQATPTHAYSSLTLSR